MSSKGLDSWHLNNNLKQVANNLFSLVKQDNLVFLRESMLQLETILTAPI